MALGVENAWRLEDDGDPKREAERLSNLRAAYVRERQGYLDKAENAEDDVTRAKWTKRADDVTAAAAADGAHLPDAGARRRETARAR